MGKERQRRRSCGIPTVFSLPESTLMALLKSLTFREREVIKLRYGIGDGYTYTLEEVGKIFKVTRERVRRLEAKAIRKLEDHFRRHDRAKRRTPGRRYSKLAMVG